MFSTGLKDDERERLAWVAEECGEVIQAAMKILRHGYESTYHNGITNRAQLEVEISHVFCAIGLMMEKMDVDINNINEAQMRKLIKEKYFHFQ